MPRRHPLVPIFAAAITLFLVPPVRANAPQRAAGDEPVRVSGRYPHLAVFNRQNECGIGAVVPWAGRLWFLTYAPHQPRGSDDKLYELDDALTLRARPESVGGTPAGRMVHRESNQLVIGPYFIDDKATVRAVPPRQMPGRLTAVARHLTDAANRVYVYDMEGALYEVDVRSLAVTKLFDKPVPGWHAKGAYTAQGRFVAANNGETVGQKFERPPYLVGADAKGPEEAGSLAEWDGRTWRIIERRQFTEVTGPAGIAPDDATRDQPLWTVGWDRRSLILKVLKDGQWQTFRLPKSDYSYDPKHGWYTEWPRIREVGGARYLMNMHGGWFEFLPAANRPTPIGSYLKVTADFAPWKDQIVFGCDDASLLQNPLLGQSQSNLWFTTWENLKQAGRPVGWGGPWVRDDVRAGEPSVPYLFEGYDQRVVHLSHEGDEPVTFTIEIDPRSDGQWQAHEQVTVPARGYSFHVFPPDLKAVWVRLKADRDTRAATAYFHYGPSGGAVTDRATFDALADADSAEYAGGVIRPRGEDLGTLHYLSSSGRYYEIDKDMRLRRHDDKREEAAYLKGKATVTAADFEVDAASVILKGPDGKRYRLPKGPAAYDRPWPTGIPRGVREVVTERSLLNAHGTFYMLPRNDAGGVTGIKPVATHNKRITDFCSWRGLLVLAGTRSDAKPDGHYFSMADNTAGLWFGDVDDLWKLGKPVGTGGPWLDTAVKADAPSGPYLMTGYDRKRVELSHDADQPVTFTIEVDVTRDGSWKTYRRTTVPPNTPTTHRFPDGYAAHWVRVTADRDCRATARFVYE